MLMTLHYVFECMYNHDDDGHNNEDDHTCIINMAQECVLSNRHQDAPLSMHSIDIDPHGLLSKNNDSDSTDDSPLCTLAPHIHTLHLVRLLVHITIRWISHQQYSVSWASTMPTHFPFMEMTNPLNGQVPKP